MIKRILSNALPVLATAALLFPASRKILNASWREELGSNYQIAGRDVGATFFLLVGLLELAMAVAILWPKTHVPAGVAMAGFFVGALVFNLGFRLDAELLPPDSSALSALIPLDVSHLVLGIAVAALWRTAGRPEHLLVTAT